MITLTETSNFKIEAELIEKSKSVILFFHGWINEDTNFSDTFQTLIELNMSVVAFDMTKVTMINSVGVREWILFLEKVQSRFQYLFTALNEIMVGQANMIPNMLGKKGTPVITFEAPYFCPKCNLRQMQMLKAKNIDISNGSFTAPVFNCSKCSSPLEFDAIELEYFNFLRHSLK